MLVLRHDSQQTLTAHAKYMVVQVIRRAPQEHHHHVAALLSF